MKTATVRLPAIPWLKEQRRLVIERLDQLAFNKNGEEWFVIGQQLDQECDGCTSDDPETVVRWNPPLHDGVTPSARPACDWLIEQMLLVGLARTEKAARLIYQAMCRLFLQQLINRNESVDLLFCKIHPLPYRVNWKNVLLDLNVRRVGERYNVSMQLVEQFAEKQLCDEQLLAYSGNEQTISWKLEVTSEAWWERCVLLREKVRKSKELWKQQYLYEVARCLWQAVPRGAAIYRQWLAAMARSYPRLPRHCWSRPYAETPKPGELGVPQNSPIVANLPLQIRGVPGWALKRIKRRELEEEALKGMLEVPDL